MRWNSALAEGGLKLGVEDRTALMVLLRETHDEIRTEFERQIGRASCRERV